MVVATTNFDISTPIKVLTVVSCYRDHLPTVIFGSWIRKEKDISIITVPRSIWEETIITLLSYPLKKINNMVLRHKVAGCKVDVQSDFLPTDITQMSVLPYNLLRPVEIRPASQEALRQEWLHIKRF